MTLAPLPKSMFHKGSVDPGKGVASLLPGGHPAQEGLGVRETPG